MDEAISLNKDYTSQYYNYHRNGVVFFGLCSAIWLFDVKIDLNKAALINNTSPILTTALPWILWVCGLYCLVSFWAEWKIQSESHYLSIGNELEQLNKQTSNVIENLDKYSQDLDLVRGEIALVSVVTNNPQSILIENERIICDKYRLHFSELVNRMNQAVENAKNDVEEVSSIFDTIVNSHENKSYFKDGQFLKKDLLLQRSLRNLASIKDQTYSNIGNSVDIETPLAAQSKAFKELGDSILCSSEKLKDLSIDIKSFSIAAGFFKNKNMAVKTLIGVKVFLSGIGSIVILFYISVFAIFFYYASFIF